MRRYADFREWETDKEGEFVATSFKLLGSGTDIYHFGIMNPAPNRILRVHSLRMFTNPTANSLGDVASLHRVSGITTRNKISPENILPPEGGQSQAESSAIISQSAAADAAAVTGLTIAGASARYLGRLIMPVAMTAVGMRDSAAKWQINTAPFFIPPNSGAAIHYSEYSGVAVVWEIHFSEYKL